MHPVSREVGTLLRTLSQEERAIVLSEAGAFVQPDLDSATPNDYFDHELALLIGLGYNETTSSVDAYRAQFDTLRPHVQSITLKGLAVGRLPFQIVPQTKMPWEERMARVVVKRKTGLNYITNPSALKERETTPESHYLIVDIEDGRATRNIRPSTNRENFRATGRSGFVPEEGIMLTTYEPETLEDHNLDLVGAWHEDGYWPLLYLDDDGPRLNWGRHGFAGSGWGAPSAGRRIGA